jgi:hypothetical protein
MYRVFEFFKNTRRKKSEIQGINRVGLERDYPSRGDLLSRATGLWTGVRRLRCGKKQLA